MNRILLLAVVTASWLGAPPEQPFEAGPESTVSGHVEIRALPPRAPGALSAYARRRPVPPQTPGVPGGVEDAFVYLESLTATEPTAPGTPTVIVQRDRTIIPHASVTRVGQTVEFPNEDDVFHMLFSLSPGNRFTLGRYAPGVTERTVFENPGVVQLFCDIHAEMAGVILVVNTPHVSSVDADGEFRIGDVPAGQYRAVAWHPAAGADSVVVRVTSGEALALDFTLGGGR